jgi:hypothetical protein
MQGFSRSRKILDANFIESLGEQKLPSPILIFTNHKFVNLEEHVPLVSSATSHETKMLKATVIAERTIEATASLDPPVEGWPLSAQCDAALGTLGSTEFGSLSRS